MASAVFNPLAVFLFGIFTPRFGSLSEPCRKRVFLTSESVCGRQASVTSLFCTTGATVSNFGYNGNKAKRVSNEACTLKFWVKPVAVGSLFGYCCCILISGWIDSRPVYLMATPADYIPYDTTSSTGFPTIGCF